MCVIAHLCRVKWGEDADKKLDRVPQGVPDPPDGDSTLQAMYQN